METETNLAQWLGGRLRNEHLSLRRAATRTGLSHATIADIMKGNQPSAKTIMKLAQGFGGNGQQKLALEDQLLTLAGYRSERPEEEMGVEHGMLLDKIKPFSKSQIKIMGWFADFLIETGEGEKGNSQ